MLINFLVRTLGGETLILYLFLPMKTLGGVPSKIVYFRKIAEIFSTAQNVENSLRFFNVSTTNLCLDPT